MALCSMNMRKKAKLRAFLPQGSKSVIYLCSLRSFLQTLSSNAMTLLYDVPEIVPPWASESHSLLSCGTCSSASQLVPCSRRRVCMALYCAVHCLPELDTLFDKEPLLPAWQRKDMKKVSTRHFRRHNTTTVSVQNMTVRSNLYAETA